MKPADTTPTDSAARPRNAFWRALYPLNAVLGGLFVFLAAAFFVLWRDVFPLPEFAAGGIKNVLLENGVDLDFSSASISARGHIIINDASVRIEGTPSPFFSAERIDASFWIAPLAAGEVRLRGLRIYGGALGDTVNGVANSPAISHLFLGITKSGKWWRVDSAYFKIKTLTAYLSANISEDFSVDEFLRANGLPDKPESKPEARGAAGSGGLNTVAAKIDTFVGACEKYSKNLDMFSSPVCSARLFLSGAESSRGGLVFYSNRAVFPVGSKDARVENMRLGIRYDGGKIYEKLALAASAESFSCKDLPKSGGISGFARLSFDGAAAELSDIDISVENIEYAGVKIDNVQLQKSVLDSENYGADWRFFAAMNPHRIGGRFGVDKSLRFGADFEGAFDPQIVTRHESLADIDELKQLSFPRGLSVKGFAEGKIDSAAVKVGASFESSDCIIMNIPVRRVSGRVAFDSATQVLDAYDLSVQTREDWAVNGRFVQNLGDNRYYIFVDGTIRPMAIAHFMEKWWTRVFKSFEWRKEGIFPKADFFVEGRWGAPEYIWCFGRASGSDAAYNGVAFDDFSLNVWVAPERISLYDIRIKSSDRTAHGNMQWLYDGGKLTTFDRQTLFLVSGLSSAELVALGGEDVAEITDVVKFSRPPQITVNALMRNPHNNPDNIPDIFNVAGFAPSITEIETAKLENLHFDAKSDKTTTRVENASFDFCGGTADGNITLVRSGKKMLFDAYARAQKMNQAKFTEFLMSLDPSADSQKTAAADTPKENAAEPAGVGQNGGGKPAVKPDSGGSGFLDGGENGSVDLSLALKGDVADFAHSKGAGFASLTNPDLIRLHLFGAISRAFSALHLPLGSFDINYANSPVEISGGRVSFPRLEMGGAVMRIKGAATYDFINDDLDAGMAIYPFGGLTNLIASGISLLVNPLANAIEVTLDGKISDPKIGMEVKPINILQGEKRVLEKIRNSL